MCAYGEKELKNKVHIYHSNSILQHKVELKNKREKKKTPSALAINVCIRTQTRITPNWAAPMHFTVTPPNPGTKDTPCRKPKGNCQSKSLKKIY